MEGGIPRHAAKGAVQDPSHILMIGLAGQNTVIARNVNICNWILIDYQMLILDHWNSWQFCLFLIKEAGTIFSAPITAGPSNKGD